ncbi:MAG: 30S ribosomal protein S16 [Verrucomicrobiota bacterium]|nr:30S ribosomal protein S16 [Verrucomicrobiota bacterium]
MSLKIRLQRHGANNAPHYRVVVAESRFKRDGRFVEIVGTYDPRNKNQFKQSAIKLDRIDYWVKQGATASETVTTLIKKARRMAPAVEVPVKEAAPVAPAKANNDADVLSAALSFDEGSVEEAVAAEKAANASSKPENA